MEEKNKEKLFNLRKEYIDKINSWDIRVLYGVLLLFGSIVIACFSKLIDFRNEENTKFEDLLSIDPQVIILILVVIFVGIFVILFAECVALKRLRILYEDLASDINNERELAKFESYYSPLDVIRK